VKQEDVLFLVGFLDDCTDKWKDIGAALGFSDESLHSISQDPQWSTLQQCFRELLDQWSDWPTDNHSLQQLCVALCSKQVGHFRVGIELYWRRMTLPSQGNKFFQWTFIFI